MARGLGLKVAPGVGLKVDEFRVLSSGFRKKVARGLGLKEEAGLGLEVDGYRV